MGGSNEKQVKPAEPTPPNPPPPPPAAPPAPKNPPNQASLKPVTKSSSILSSNNSIRRNKDSPNNSILKSTPQTNPPSKKVQSSVLSKSKLYISSHNQKKTLQTPRDRPNDQLTKSKETAERKLSKIVQDRCFNKSVSRRQLFRLQDQVQRLERVASDRLNMRITLDRLPEIKKVQSVSKKGILQTLRIYM